MRIKKDRLKEIFGKVEYSKALQLFNTGRVFNYSETFKNNEHSINCTVNDGRVYYVQATCDDRTISGHCTCYDFSLTHKCTHIVAALIAFADYKNSKSGAIHTDFSARKLLDSYLNQSQLSIESEKTKLIPYIYSYYNNQYPAISLKVGRQRLYVIKDIYEFTKKFEYGSTVEYGKQLTLKHDLGEFDGASQELIKLIMNVISNEDRNSFSFYRSQYSKQYINLKGYDFERFFEMYKGQTLLFHDSKHQGLTLTEGDPTLHIKLEKLDSAEVMHLDDPKNPMIFGNKTSVFAIQDDKLMRCSQGFLENMSPFFDNRSDSTNSLTIADKDMPIFCSCVLPSIENYVSFEGEGENILSEFLPDECIPCFYFDMDQKDGSLTANVKFKYDNVLINEKSRKTAKKKNVKRNPKLEKAAHNALESIFGPHDGNYDYKLFDEDKIYDFLTEKLQEFYSIGEIYVTDRLKEKEIKPKKLSMGVSVSDGIINLDFDMGEFPFEELEELYQSLLLKKKYHKLKDGRYLTLDGSSYETLAEFTHMTQLDPEELKSGHVTLPAYRGLYLDSIMNDNENIMVERDKNFKSMVRNFKTVSDSDYVIPDELRSTLRPYQKTGYRWLKTLDSSHFGGILADDMGLGKTLQVITYLRSVYESEQKPSIIVCPSSLVLNWADEFDKFAPDMSYELILGNAKARKELIEADHSGRIVITSYDLLKKDIASYSDISFYACVLDEGQYIKNRSTLASKSVKKINCIQRLVLTGTPIENRLGELWNLFDFLMPGYLFNYNQFSEKLEKPIIKSADASAQEQLKKMVQPFVLRRLKSEVLKELPPKVEYVHKIQLSEAERKVYLASAMQAKNGTYKGKLEILAALTRLRQICCDPNLCFDNYSGEESKLDACISLCREAVDGGHQVLLFSQFTSMLDLIRKRLDEERISNFTIQGSTPKEKRAQLVKSFNNHGADIFLISLKAGGTGLNLTAADVVIHYDPWWNIAAQNQATDRAHRIGQKSSVSIYKLIAKDTIEEKILKLQEKKASLMDVISDDSDQNIMNMTQQELLDLL